MSENLTIKEPDSDLDPMEYWRESVSAVERFLPSPYVAEVQALLKSWNQNFTDTQVIHVRLGRSRKRPICRAIYHVGIKYKQAAEHPQTV